MYKWPYAKEPFDFKLFVLLFIKKIWIVTGAALMGVLLIGGGYYLKNVILGGPLEYEITTTYMVEYNTRNNETGELYSYINSATWGSLVQTDWFVDRAWDHATKDGMVPETYGIEKKDLKNFFYATMPSDLRIPTATVTTASQELTVLLDLALQQTFTDFADEQPEMDGIKVLDKTPLAVADKDVRTLRACILGALTGLFLAGFAIALWIIWDDSVYLPETFTYRYGLFMAGALGKGKELPDAQETANIEHLFPNMDKGIILSVGRLSDPEKVLGALVKEGFSELISAEKLQEESYEKLRNAGGVLLVVEAGAHNAGEIGHVLHELQLQDIAVQGAFLCNADMRLLNAYRYNRK